MVLPEVAILWRVLQALLVACWAALRVETRWRALLVLREACWAVLLGRLLRLQRLRQDKLL